MNEKHSFPVGAAIAISGTCVGGSKPQEEVWWLQTQHFRLNWDRGVSCMVLESIWSCSL